MPSLRDGGGAVHELRSSKNLIGASPSKCDVVVRHSGVRDLHALLTLAPDRASATLVPFSAADGSVCYLNRRAVPVEGAAVVHGDRIAFGSPDADSFTFELTGFLLDASSDALLSEFVERKLRQSSTRRRANAPVAMEPPPSLSSSNVSSAQSLSAALEDSILDRTANHESAVGGGGADPPADSRLSTAERNAAEVEKLRLSQQLREVDSRQLDESVDHDDHKSLNVLLPGSSEPTRSSQSRKPRLTELVKTLHVPNPPPPPSSGPSTAAPEQPKAHKPQRTALHLQLIDRTLRHKRQELVTQAFMRWRRGLHIQSQRRQTRAQQLHNLRARLVRLRRNRAFFQWRALASLSSQVLSCRLDSFQERNASRSLVKAWTRWKLRHCSLSLRRRQLLRSAVLRLRASGLQRAFHTWLRYFRELQRCENLQQSERDFARKWDARMAHVAQRHRAQRVARRLATVLRLWRSLTANRLQRLRVLRTLALRRSWRLVHRALDDERKRHDASREKQQEEHATEHELLRHQVQARDARLQELQLQVRKRDASIQRLREQQQQERETCETGQLHDWSKSLETFLESAVKRVGRDLEQILVLAEDDVAGARFAAARALVEVVLEQKVHNSNERVQLQDELLRQRQRQDPPAKTLLLDDSSPEPPLGPHAKFLRDMIEQRQWGDAPAARP
ncbi:hypothetical protein PybrP1_013132 [[Pythium] brassicae (nom. inval.)]|nr:hypothetical protein PybrP1_013132 [[Pythium] brassicae (nom. inval.)]